MKLVVPGVVTALLWHVSLAQTALSPTPTQRLNAPGCDSADAVAVAATSAYAGCQADSQFNFDPAAGTVTTESAFCNSVNCLQVYRALKARGALVCSIVSGLELVQLNVAGNPEKCFGPDAASGNSDVITRPSPSKSGSGSAGDDSGSGVATPAPTTTAPSTIAPPTTVPPTEAPTLTPTPTPTPTTKMPSSGSGSSGSGVQILPPAATTAPSGDSTNSGSDSGSGIDTGTIVAIAGVSIGVIAVIGSLIYAASKRKNKRRRVKRSTNSGGGPETATYQELSSYYGDPTRPSGTFAHRNSRPRGFTSTAAWHSGTAGIGSVFVGWDEELIATVRVPYEKLTFDALISRGGYGEVYRGTYRGQLVAIKTLLPERRRDIHQIQSFLGEVKMMAGMEHERIVRLIGVAWDSLEELSVVSEFLECGDLRTVLTGFEKSQSHAHGFDAAKVKIALHVAHALTYMHTLQPIVLHRDLKSRNILLDRELNAKITDFGVSRERSDRTMTAGVGSSLWMAPEVMMGERYDEKADIFSFGVVLSELDSHVLPYATAVEKDTGRRLPDAVVLQMVSLGRLRVAFTREDQSEIALIGLRCVALSPADRPTAAELLHLIHQVWRRD